MSVYVADGEGDVASRFAFFLGGALGADEMLKRVYSSAQRIRGYEP